MPHNSSQPVATLSNYYHQQYPYPTHSFSATPTVSTAATSDRREQQPQQVPYAQYHDQGLGVHRVAYRTGTPSIAAASNPPLHPPCSQANRLVLAPPAIFYQANLQQGIPHHHQRQIVAQAPVASSTSSHATTCSHPFLPYRSRLYSSFTSEVPTMAESQRQQQQQQQESQQQQRQVTGDEMEEMQRLSNKWEPETNGPLVSQRSSTSAIVSEYASAGETFQQKTTWLAQKYPSYRTVRGDGRCGWRAIAYGYYEGLIRLGDTTRFLEEEARLRSLNNVLNAAGFEQYLYEDFADEVFDLLRKLGASLAANNAQQVLHDTFNDDNISMCIITHLRSLTKAWMVTNPADYEAFCEGQPVDQYADDRIMPVTSEIDHVGMSALNNVLLTPAGIGLEVSYLDQSLGTEVNVHRFDQDGSGMPIIHVVRLLYRPGHFDMLYKPEDLPPEPTNVATYLQYSSHAHHEPVYDLGVSDLMTMIPGMSYASSCGGWMSSNSSSSFASSDPFQPMPTVAPQSSAGAIPQTPTSPTPQMPGHQNIQPQSYSMQSAHATAAVLPPNQIHQSDFAVNSTSHAPVTHTVQNQLGGPFRPSVWELEPDLQTTPQVPLQTSIFRNSHFNTAHFLNPDFQPEEWSPEHEYINTTTTTARPR